MAIITTPITVGTFDKMWISNVNLNTQGAGTLRLAFNPYDGATTLTTNTVQKFFPQLFTGKAENKAFEDAVTALLDECKRQAKTTKKVLMLHVNARSPQDKVMATIMFEKEEGETKPNIHNIGDCFALAATDQKFGIVFQTSLVAFAQKSGLSFQA